ncbi:MAG: hypothetical protein EA379_10270 [Phycisphaerales bacterium]|nr:MAG: hypothetical protein EA379_10270 [Phycisphaerales bacterium]
MHRRFRPRCRLALAALAAGWCVGAAWAEGATAVGASGASGAIERPEAAGRIVRVFDFEERPQNPEPVPMHWVRAQHDPPERDRPTFPEWNRAAFDTAHATSGEHSVRLPTSGGSVSLRLSSGVIPALPGADYMVVANVRTEGLVHARARLTARFLDEHRRPIRHSESRSALVDTRAEWRTVRAELIGDANDAAWIQIDLELLQPRDQTAAGRGPAVPPRRINHAVMLQDVRAGAWFDDVMVYQLPRISLTTEAPGNVVLAPDRPSMDISVRDLTGERLRARVRVIDIDGRTVARHETDLPGGGRRTAWSPELPAYGWFRAVLDVLNEETVVARRDIDFAWLPPAPPDGFPEAQRFGLIVEDSPPSRLTPLPHAMPALGAGAASLGAWSPTLERDDARARVEAMEPIVEALAEQDVALTFVIGPAPVEIGLALGRDFDSPLDLLGAERTRGEVAPWEGHLHDALSRFGQRVRRWQLGATGDDGAYWRPGLKEELARVERELSRLVPGPVVTLPWSPAQPIDERIGKRALVVSLPHTLTTSTIGEHAGEWIEREDVTLTLRAPAFETYGLRNALRTLAVGAIEAWRAGVPRLALEAPWSWSERDRADVASPSPALTVWRQLAQRLGGRRIVGELPLARGVRCYILDGHAGGALVAWNEWAAPEDARIDMRLGDRDVTVVDLHGNETSVPFVDGRHTIMLDDMPVFIEGVDERLAAFHAGFRVVPEFLPAEASLHAIELELYNPWPVAIGGTLRVVEPRGWRIEPRVAAFSVPAGERRRLRMDVAFGLGEEAGKKRIVAELDMQADRGRAIVRVGAPLEVGLSTLHLTPSYAVTRGPDGRPRDVVVSLSITNNGDLPTTLQAFALAAGFPREQAPVSDLGPGQTAIRRFVFPNGAETLTGTRVRVGLIEVRGAGRLNKSVTIE